MVQRYWPSGSGLTHCGWGLGLMTNLPQCLLCVAADWSLHLDDGRGLSFYTAGRQIGARMHMLNRTRLVSCLLLSVVTLGFLVAQANAAGIQQVAFLYEGHVRLTAGRFYGADQYAEVALLFDEQGILEVFAFATSGNWNIVIICTEDGVVIIPGGDGSFSVYCTDLSGYLKFWTKGFYPYAPATLLFYLTGSPYGLRGLWSGVLAEMETAP